MSQENVELLRSLQDDWNRGDTTADPERFHPDLEYLPRRAATEGAYRGLAGLESFIADTSKSSRGSSCISSSPILASGCSPGATSMCEREAAA